jgi:hypothetical protein
MTEKIELFDPQTSHSVKFIKPRSLELADPVRRELTKDLYPNLLCQDMEKKLLLLLGLMEKSTAKVMAEEMAKDFRRKARLRRNECTKDRSLSVYSLPLGESTVQAVARV